MTYGLHWVKNGWFVLSYLLLLGFALTTYGADENKPWSIRVGEHGKYTRVVFDMEQSVAYEVVPQGKDGKHLRVVFNAGALASEEYILLIDTGIVNRIHVKPDTEKTFAEILLTQPAEVKEHFRLDGPHRVIVDVVQTRNMKKSAEKAAVKKP